MEYYTIKTIEFHEAAIERLNQQEADRWDRINKFLTDEDDCFVSMRVCQTMRTFHNLAIDTIKGGMKTTVRKLVDSATGRTITADEIENHYGYSWALHPSETELIKARGGRYLPTGANSRIQRSLGVEERWIEVECSRYMNAYGQAWMRGHLAFSLKEITPYELRERELEGQATRSATGA